MSDLNRLRELAALLRPMQVTEARVKTRADLEKKFQSVEGTIKDLADDLSEGGTLETMMRDVGVASRKDSIALLKTLSNTVKTIQSSMMEVEGLLFSAMTEGRHPEPVNEAKKATYNYELILKNSKGKVVATKTVKGNFAEDEIEDMLGDFMEDHGDAVETDVKKIKVMNEAKNHLDENTYQSVASWKRALKAKYGDKVKYFAHEGTIDAFIGSKQVGDWDDTTGTVY
jgi:hypothetical protein